MPRHFVIEEGAGLRKCSPGVAIVKAATEEALRFEIRIWLARLKRFGLVRLEKVERGQATSSRPKRFPNS